MALVDQVQDDLRALHTQIRNLEENVDHLHEEFEGALLQATRSVEVACAQPSPGGWACHLHVAPAALSMRASLSSLSSL